MHKWCLSLFISLFFFTFSKIMAIGRSGVLLSRVFTLTEFGCGHSEAKATSERVFYFLIACISI